MKKLPLLLAVTCLSLAACDFKRNGQVTLTGAASIPLRDANGSAAELVAGPAEVTIGGSRREITVRLRQPNRAEINFRANVSGDVESGNFTLSASQSGQPVDIASVRSYKVTGATQRRTEIEDTGNRRCMVDVTYDPCDENWTVTFSNGSGALGSFASVKGTTCNERRGFPYACYTQHEPRIPDFPRGGGRHGINGGGIYNGALELGAEKVSFDGR